MSRRKGFLDEKDLCSLQALLFTALLAAPLAHNHAQTAPAPDPLFQTIQSLDAKLFDAYNHCDLEKFGSLLADDLEFYHDKSGLSSGRQALVEGVKNNICGKVTRELVPGTLEIYPIANYGAWRSAFTVSTIPDTRIPSLSARRSSFTSGKTKMEYGRSLVSSASTTMAQQSDGQFCNRQPLRSRRGIRGGGIAIDETRRGC